MYIHADDEEATHLFIVDIAAKKIVRLCQWANDETGEYCVFKTDGVGNVIVILDPNGQPTIATEVIKSDIKFIDIREWGFLLKIEQKVRDTMNELEEQQSTDEWIPF